MILQRRSILVKQKREAVDFDRYGPSNAMDRIFIVSYWPHLLAPSHPFGPEMKMLSEPEVSLLHYAELMTATTIASCTSLGGAKLLDPPNMDFALQKLPTTNESGKYEIR